MPFPRLWNTSGDSLPPSLPALDLLIDEVRAQRQAQYAHWDSLDTKAGLVLGFAGVLASIAPGRWDFLATGGRVAALIAAALALHAFWPRKIPGFLFGPMREELLQRTDSNYVKRRLLATLIDMDDEAGRQLTVKAKRVKRALVVLLIAALLAAIGGDQPVPDDEKPSEQQ